MLGPEETQVEKKLDFDLCQVQDFPSMLSTTAPKRWNQRSDIALG